jgi:flavin-binding protein dodecin
MPPVVATITICPDRPPFPLKTASQWEAALDCISERVNRTIERLSGKAKCRGSNLLIYPVMDAAAFADACEWADATVTKLDELRAVAEKVGLGDAEVEVWQVKLKDMDLRLRKAMEDARSRGRMSKL